MHIAPDNILVSCTIALFLGGWSFLFCYLLFSRARISFYVLSAIIIAIDLFLAPLYFIGVFFIVASSIVAIFGSAIQSLLNRKYKISKDGFLSFFGLHFVTAHLPILFYIWPEFVGRNRTVDLYMKPFSESLFLFLLLYSGPALSTIPVYMFQSYRPRPGIDTHFPDVENN